MLATEFARMTRLATATVAPTPLGLRSAVVLAELAAEAAPENPENWRLLLFAARLAEDREAADRAVAELGRLVPADDVVTLARLQTAIDERGRTVEERSEFLRFLVDAGREGRLGPAVAARIAYDLALLRQRIGDVSGFAESLLTAMDLDPSFVAAARTAYQFFSATDGAPEDEAELLVNLLLADPTDQRTILRLAQLLLQEGAYEGAARLHAMAMDVIAGGSALRESIEENVVADEALARWAAGDVAGAIRLIEDRERLKQDELVAERERRRRQEQTDPGSTLDEPPIPESLPLGLNLMVTRLAIFQTEGPSIVTDVPAVRGMVRNMQQRLEAEARANADFDPDAEGDAATPPDVERMSPAEAHAALVAEMRTAIDAEFTKEIEGRELDRQTSARMRLHHAWTAVLLLDDPATARRRMGEANELSPQGLSEEAVARFEGWILLREGDPEAALAPLRSVAETDRLARLGIAIALEQLGDTAAARVEYRGVAIAARGTMAGVIAERRLRTVYGERMQPTATAARLEGLVATVPVAMDRLSWNRTGGLRLRASFREQRVGPFAPVMLDLTLINNSPVPLALDPQGPIRPTVVVVPNVVVSSDLIDAPPVVVVDFQRRLRLESREELTVSVDLRRTALGTLLLDATQIGANVRVEAFINHQVNRIAAFRMPVFYPLPISADGESGYLRVDGFPLAGEQPDGTARRSGVVAAMIDAVDRMRPEATPGFDVLGAVSRLSLARTDDQTPPVILGIRRDAAQAMAAAFPRLDPFTQAWLIATSPIGVALPQYSGFVARSEDPHLIAAWLINMAGRVDDPVLVKALASDDARVQLLARAVDERLRQAAPGR